MAYRRTERETARLAARYEAIIAAAQAVASESGLAALQIIPVAERAGIAAGTVYRYFPSKDDLVAALVTTTAEREIAAIRGAAAAAPGVLSALAAAIMTFAAGTLRTRRLAWAMLAVESGTDGGRFAFRRNIGDEFESLIRAAIAAGHLPDQPPAAMAAAVIGAIVESLVGPLAANSARPDTEYATVQTLALFALRALGVADAHARGLVLQAEPRTRKSEASNQEQF
jgi:AcrR family transcriptional regulator